MSAGRALGAQAFVEEHKMSVVSLLNLPRSVLAAVNQHVFHQDIHLVFDETAFISKLISVHGAARI